MGQPEVISKLPLVMQNPQGPQAFPGLSKLAPALLISSPAPMPIP